MDDPFLQDIEKTILTSRENHKKALELRPGARADILLITQSFTKAGISIETLSEWCILQFIQVFMKELTEKLEIHDETAEALLARAAACVELLGERQGRESIRRGKKMETKPDIAGALKELNRIRTTYPNNTFLNDVLDKVKNLLEPPPSAEAAINACYELNPRHFVTDKGAITLSVGFLNTRLDIINRFLEYKKETKNGN